jgi:hypothetical protein
MDYKIIKLEPKDYEKCGGIWNMESHPERTKKWYDEIISGNRIVFIYTENNEFIGEGALVLDNGDRDYPRSACLPFKNDSKARAKKSGYWQYYSGFFD